MGALVWLCYLLVILTVNSYRFYGLRRTVKSINTLEAVRGNDDDMGTNRTVAARSVLMNEKVSSSMKTKYQKSERKTQRVVVRSARNLTPLFLNSPGVIFNSLIKRGKSHYITGANTNRTASTSKEKDSEYGGMHIVKQPEYYRTVSYDYLATSSLGGLEAYPNIRFHKGDIYLSRWWDSAKKWGLLCQELKELDENLVNNQMNASKASVSNVMAPDDIEYDEEDIEEVDDEDISAASDMLAVASREDDEFIADYMSQLAKNISKVDSSESLLEGDDIDYEGELDIGADLADGADLVDGVDANPFLTNTDKILIKNVSLVDNFDAHTPKNPNIPNAVPSRPHKQRVPLQQLYSYCRKHRARLICIGDVHGCVEELKDLLLAAKYRPGDMVLLLGDLVAKGPSSVEVVRLAMDIGALSVRGNHDHEVVRQGILNRKNIKNILNEPIQTANVSRGNEHLRIANQLNENEFNWLASLPYYINSIDLGTVFVHAGFQPGIKLSEQDPWVMMSMRSILPDGRISTRCFHNYAWPKAFKGPQTVLFGHDAARGLQQYKHAIGLDTGCVYGGRLTALVLPDHEYISVPARRAYLKYGRSKSHKMYNYKDDVIDYEGYRNKHGDEDVYSNFKPY